MKWLGLRRASLLLTLAVLVAGCARSPSSRFYTLTPLGQKGEQQPVREGSSHSVAVRVLPVQIPDYLERPQIVTRDGRNELKMGEFHRWGGSLSDNMTAVLAENLGLLLGSDQVFVHPVGTEKVDYTVAIEVLRLDSRPGDQVHLEARYAISSAPAKEEAPIHLVTFTERLSDSRYETVVAGISHLLEQLSRRIAREIDARRA